MYIYIYIYIYPGSPESSWESLGVPWTSLGVLWASLEALGASWDRPGGPWGDFGGLGRSLDQSWEVRMLLFRALGGILRCHVF